MEKLPRSVCGKLEPVEPGSITKTVIEEQAEQHRLVVSGSPEDVMTSLLLSDATKQMIAARSNRN